MRPDRQWPSGPALRPRAGATGLTPRHIRLIRRGPTYAVSFASPTRAFTVGAWRSLAARIVRDDEVGGSNPLAPTNPPQCPIPTFTLAAFSRRVERLSEIEAAPVPG